MARGRDGVRLAHFGWAWTLAFAACIGLAGRAPMLALLSADAGTLLTAICGANGPKAIDGQDQNDRAGTHAGACWCGTHLAALPPETEAARFARSWTSIAPEQAGVETIPPVVACKPASTGPPHHLV